MITLPGLCGGCLHAQTIRTGRGSVFILCERSRTDPSFARYPALPVVACRGFTPSDGAADRRDAATDHDDDTPVDDPPVDDPPVDEPSGRR